MKLSNCIFVMYTASTVSDFVMCEYNNNKVKMRVDFLSVTNFR